MTSVADTVRGILAGSVDFEAGLDALTVAPPADVDPVLVALLRERAATLVRQGWQPADLHRVVARRGDPVQTRLVVDALADLLRHHRRGAVDPRWLAQADDLDARVWWRDDATYPAEAAARCRVDRVTLLDALLGLLGVLSALPPVEVLLPPPGAAVPRRAHRGVDGRTLQRVRALLAKAESTSFPAEAEAYSAKAQEIIARHSLEEALLGNGLLGDGLPGDALLGNGLLDGALSAPAEHVPLARRIGVDHPYENEKASLLDAVARANRCRAVWSPELGFATVFGFDADIDAVELLHTSLLVQANRAMSAAEPRTGKARIKAFRRSFLIAYAVRIGERLAAAAGQALAAVTDRGDLLPVLASRDAQVREAMDRMFPRTVRARGSRVDSLEGWESGREAADRVRLR